MEHSEEEIRQYVDIVDKVAIISKTDLQGNITFANDIFCEVAGYSKDELLGKPHNMLRHPDMPKSAFQDLWETIKSGNVWSGKVKNQAKDGSAYHVNAHIFPIFDENKNIKEYMAVRFLMTEEAEEQRKFKAQVIKKLGEEKSKQQELNKEIQRLNNLIKLNESKKDNEGFGLEQLEKERREKKKLLGQVASYEKELANMSKVTEATVQNSQKRSKELEQRNKALKDKYDLFEKKVIAQESKLEAQTKKIEDYDQRLATQAQIIENLKDVIASLEEDKEKLLNGEKVNG